MLLQRREDEKMSVFVIETYLVKPERQEEFKALIQRLLEYKKENPQLFKEVKSFRLFRQTFGGLAGAYIEMWEFNNMAELEKCWTRENKDEGFMRIHEGFLRLIDPTTFSMKMWTSVM